MPTPLHHDVGTDRLVVGSERTCEQSTPKDERMASPSRSSSVIRPFLSPLVEPQPVEHRAGEPPQQAQADEDECPAVPWRHVDVAATLGRDHQTSSSIGPMLGMPAAT